MNPLLVNALPNTLAANVPNDTGRNPFFVIFFNCFTESFY